MTRAGHKLKELRYRIEKVGKLGQKEEPEGLREVTVNAYDRESHARKIAKCVPDEDLCEGRRE